MITCRLRAAEQWNYAVRLLLPLLSLAALYGIAVYFGGELALRTLFGQDIEEAYPLVRIMACIPFFIVAPLPAAVVLSALRRANMRFISQCLACAGTLLIGLPLVFQYGLVGGAVALVVTEVLFAIGQWACLFWLLHRSSKAETAQALR